MRKWKILITPKEACDALGRISSGLLEEFELCPVYGRVNDRHRLAELLSDKDGVVLDVEPITSSILEHCLTLKVISRFGEGCDAIDFNAAKAKGIRITRTRGAASRSVARHALSLILAMTHNVTENDRNLKNGKWDRLANLSDDELTVGIVGLGMIGKELAVLLSSCGFRVLVYSRHTRDSRFEHSESIEKLIEMSDIISLHLPLTAETDGMFSGQLIGLLKGKYLVNTARGGLVNETALLACLEKNELKGYATDVFVEEPPAGISQLLASHPKVICTPHIGALDEATARRMTERALKNALYCLQGEHDKIESFAL